MKTAQKLIESGINVELKDSYGNTTLENVLDELTSKSCIPISKEVLSQIAYIID